MDAAGRDVDVVLFDLGGVLIRLRGAGWMRDLAGIATEEEVWQRWLACPWVRRFESGCCAAEEFAAGMVDEWDLSTDAAGFLEQFRGLPVGLFDGAAELVTNVGASVRVGCLSNTNALHWTLQDDWGLAELFDECFLSHELGLLKPDREIFEQVVERLDVPAGRVLFLDDHPTNVAGARSAGLRAERARGIDEARSALERHGVVVG